MIGQLYKPADRNNILNYGREAPGKYRGRGEEEAPGNMGRPGICQVHRL